MGAGEVRVRSCRRLRPDANLIRDPAAYNRPRPRRPLQFPGALPPLPDRFHVRSDGRLREGENQQASDAEAKNEAVASGSAAQAHLRVSFSADCGTHVPAGPRHRRVAVLLPFMYDVLWI